MNSLDKNVRNRYEISEMLKRLLLRVSRLEGNSNGWNLAIDTIAIDNYLSPVLLADYPVITSVIPFNTLPSNAIITKADVENVASNYIPLAGTLVNKPVTGDIEFTESNANIGFVRKNTSTDWVGEIKFSNSNSSLMSRDTANTIFSKININKEGIAINNSSLSKGLYSETIDYTPNYPTDGTENKIFPQIKYIKDNFCEEAPENGSSYVRNNGAWAVAISGGGGVVTVTLAEFNALIASSTLVPSTMYRVNGIDANFCDGFFLATTANTFDSNGAGLFRNPNYSLYQLWRPTFTLGVTVDVGIPVLNEVYVNGSNSFIWKMQGLYITNQDILPDGVYTSGSNSVTVSGANVVNYGIGNIVIFGNKHWINVNGNLGARIDELNLNAEWLEVTTNTLPVINEIVYDIANDWISTRKDQRNNEITFLKSGIFNFVKTFNWGSTSVNNKISDWGGVICNFNFTFNNNNVTTFIIQNNVVGTGFFNNNTGNNFIFQNNTGNNYNVSDNRGQAFTIQNNIGNGYGVVNNAGRLFTIQNNTGNTCGIRDNIGNNYSFNGHIGNTSGIRDNIGNNYSFNSNVGNICNVRFNTGNNYSFNSNVGNSCNVNNNSGNGYIFNSNVGNSVTLINNVGNNFTVQNNSGNTCSVNNNSGTNVNINNKNIGGKTVQYCNFKDIVIDASVDISLATHLFLAYNKDIVKNSANVIAVSYINASNVQTITDINT